MALTREESPVCKLKRISSGNVSENRDAFYRSK